MSLLQDTEGKLIVFLVGEAEQDTSRIENRHRFLCAGDYTHPISKHGRLQVDACKKWIEDILKSIERNNQITYSSPISCAFTTACILTKLDTPCLQYDELKDIKKTMSTESINNRISDMLNYLESESNKKTMIIVTHSNVINMIIKMVQSPQKRIEDKSTPIKIDHTGVTIMVFNDSDKTWSIRLINGTDHLRNI